MPDQPAGLRVLLVDDEAAAIIALTELLAAHPDVEIVATVRSVEKALLAVAQRGHELDVVFVDVEMPRHGGFDLLAGLGPSARVVFVTAYDDYAVDAFEAGACDYLLKPVTAERLARCLSRLRGPAERSHTEGDRDSQAFSSSNRPRTLPVAGGSSLVEDGQILWIEAVGNYSDVHLADGKTLLVRQSMAAWEKMLPSAAFIRVSRSLIVSMNRIQKISWRSQGGTRVEFRGCAEQLTLGRAGTDRLKRVINDRRQA